LTSARDHAGPLSGTLTFLFTDLEGSTGLWERYPDAMKPALARHDAILRAAVEAGSGQVIKTTGDGLMAVFASATAGVRACISAQRDLRDEPWGETGALRVRMGLHCGEAQTRVGDYFGPTVNRAARIMAAGHGGQVLLSSAAAALLMDHLPDRVTLLDLGEQRLKDLGRPEHVFQLVHPDLVREFPPLATLNSRPNNLPTHASTFVGRQAELEQIRARLADETVRLLTFTGPGGTGKTRLALRAAAEQIERFDDGVFFVDLAAVADTASVLAVIARTIGVSEASDQSLLEDLKSRLRSSRMLLILDNVEQVTSAAPTLVELLSECANLRLLVTSREALHVRGEHLFIVPPLSLPILRPHHAAAAEVAGYEAVQLFVDRAQEVKPDFELTDSNAAAVADICLRLDGLPLAIELATARLRLFTPEALRERLGNRLQLLRSGARDLPARQQTLRATIEWSYQLLEAGEQQLLDLLSVFAGTQLDAVEAVAADLEQVTSTGIDVVDGVASLLDKSLIRQVVAGEAEPRLMMLETIKEYAAERLADRPAYAAAATRAHAGYFADFAHDQWEHLTGRHREPALATMAADIENLRLSWRYWVTNRDLVQLNKLVDSLWLLYDARGWYHATIDLITDLLDVLSSYPSTPQRQTQEITLRTSLARALMAIQGYTPQVEEAHRRALELFQGDGLPQLFPVLRSLATFYNFSAEFDKGAQVGREILRLAEQEHDSSMLVDGHLVLGANLAFLNDLHGGLEHLDQAIASFKSGPYRPPPFRLGNNPGVACFTTSAFILWLLGSPDRAVQRANEAVALAAELDHPFTQAYALYHSGFLHLWRREHDIVADRAVGVLEIAERHDFQIWHAVGSCLQGAGNTGLGQYEEGLAQIRRGISLYQGLKTPPVFWPLLLFLYAGAQLRAGRAADGLTLIDEALAVAARGAGLTLLPDFQLLKGDLLLALPETQHPDPEPWFRRALDMATKLDAKMLQLRAAARLCRLQVDNGGPSDDTTLRAIYDTFTEGFATADLTEARSLLTGR
jgi:predicted ATPase/class 3 adenylate cyclase